MKTVATLARDCTSLFQMALEDSLRATALILNHFDMDGASAITAAIIGSRSLTSIKHKVKVLSAAVSTLSAAEAFVNDAPVHTKVLATTKAAVDIAAVWLPPAAVVAAAWDAVTLGHELLQAVAAEYGIVRAGSIQAGVSEKLGEIAHDAHELSTHLSEIRRAQALLATAHTQEEELGMTQLLNELARSTRYTLNRIVEKTTQVELFVPRPAGNNAIRLRFSGIEHLANSDEFRLPRVVADAHVVGDLIRRVVQDAKNIFNETSESR